MHHCPHPAACAHLPSYVTPTAHSLHTILPSVILLSGYSLPQVHNSVLLSSVNVLDKPTTMPRPSSVWQPHGLDSDVYETVAAAAVAVPPLVIPLPDYCLQ